MGGRMSELERLIAEGNRAEESGDLARACDLYRRAVVLDPPGARPKKIPGTGLKAGGDVKGPGAAYGRAPPVEPQTPWANYNLGKLLYTRAAYADAEDYLSRALATRPAF